MPAHSSLVTAAFTIGVGGAKAGDAPFAALVLVLAVSPMPMGSVGLLSASLWAAIVGIVVAAQAVTMIVRPTYRPLSRRPLGLSLAALVLMIVWIVLQSAGWTPAAWHHPLWREVEWLLEAHTAPVSAAIGPAMSINRFATGTALMNLLACAGVFWLTLSTCRSYERKWLLLRCIVVIQCAYALWGLIHFFGRLDAGVSVPGGLPAPALGRLRSTFFNANNFAAFANIGVLLCATQLMRLVHRGITVSHGILPLLRSGLQTLLGSAGGPWVFALCLISAATLLTGSRGGLAALTAGMGVLAYLGTHRRKTRVAVISVLLVFGVGATWLSGANTLARLKSEVGSSDAIGQDRLGAWAASLDLVEARPWLGTGFGTFADAFQTVRSPDLAATYERAHNDYLEFAVELGLPAALLWLFTLLSLVLMIAGMHRRSSRNHLFVRLALAAVTTTGMHSLVDFPLQLPANAYLLASVLALPFATDRVRIGRRVAAQGATASTA